MAARAFGRAAKGKLACGCRPHDEPRWYCPMAQVLQHDLEQAKRLARQGIVDDWYAVRQARARLAEHLAGESLTGRFTAREMAWLIFLRQLYRNGALSEWGV